MFLLIGGLVLGFCASVFTVCGNTRSIFSKDNPLGCLLATVITGALIYWGITHPAVQSLEITTANGAPKPRQVVAIPGAAVATARPAPAITRANTVSFDSYETFTQAALRTPQSGKTPFGKLQVLLLNRDFDAARQTLVELQAQSGDLEEQTKARIEQQALRQIKPIPASDINTNLTGYQFLSELRPGNQTYRSKVSRYGG